MSLSRHTRNPKLRTHHDDMDSFAPEISIYVYKKIVFLVIELVFDSIVLSLNTFFNKKPICEADMVNQLLVFS